MQFNLPIVTRNNSLEIWVVKLRILLIYKIILKSIATARSECKAKQENNASYNTCYIVPDLIDLMKYLLKYCTDKKLVCF